MQSKHEVYGHVLGTHLATAQEEVVSQYDFNEETMDTGLEAEIPRSGTGSQGIESEPNDIRVFSFFELNATFLTECRYLYPSRFCANIVLISFTSN